MVANGNLERGVRMGLSIKHRESDVAYIDKINQVMYGAVEIHGVTLQRTTMDKRAHLRLKPVPGFEVMIWPSELKLCGERPWIS